MQWLNILWYGGQNGVRCGTCSTIISIPVWEHKLRVYSTMIPYIEIHIQEILFTIIFLVCHLFWLSLFFFIIGILGVTVEYTSCFFWKRRPKSGTLEQHKSCHYCEIIRLSLDFTHSCCVFNHHNDWPYHCYT